MVARLGKNYALLILFLIRGTRAIYLFCFRTRGGYGEVLFYAILFIIVLGNEEYNINGATYSLNKYTKINILKGEPNIKKSIVTVLFLNIVTRFIK